MYEYAVKFAKKAHEGQKDRAGQPYILHPLTVAEYCTGDIEKVCAVLHDVVEDTDITIGDIGRRFGKEIAGVLKCLTHRKGESYQDYLERVKKNPIAVKVKLADLRHNMQLDRLPYIEDADIKRYAKYVEAVKFLKS